MAPDQITSAHAQPLSELVGRLSDDLQSLVRKEGELASLELGRKLDSVKTQAVTLGLGIAVVAGGALVLLFAAVLGLAMVLPLWAAALVVGGGLTLIGAVMIASGKAKLSKLNLRPELALDNVKRDVAAIKGAAT